MGSPSPSTPTEGAQEKNTGGADHVELAQPHHSNEESQDSLAPSTWTLKSAIAMLGLCGLYVGSQIPAYFVGGSLTFMVEDIAGGQPASWLTVAYTLPLAAVAPFCGYLQDLFGRRYVSLIGGLLLVLGCLLVALAHTYRQALVGMGFSGAGAAIGELTALAGMSELVPVNKRGIYLAYVTGFVLPFTPYVLYCQLLSTYRTWRWGLWICLIWCALWWVVTAVSYFPQSQTRLKGAAARAAIKRIDYIGGLTSIIGVTLLLVALQSGGYTHAWTSAYVLAQLFIGFALIVIFVIWEWKYCKEPMVPHEMFKGQRIVAMMFAMAFIAGMNFYAMLNFFPIEYAAAFDPDPAKVGLRAVAAGLTTTAGAVFGNALLSVFKGHNRTIIFVGCVFMTAFTGALAAVTPDREGLAIGLGAATGLGVGTVLVPTITIALTVTPDETIATCVALSLTVRAIGGAIGASVYFNVYDNKLTKNLPLFVAEFAAKAGLPLKDVPAFVQTFLTDPASAAGLPGVTAAVLEAGTIGIRWAYTESLKYVWLSSIAFGACAIVLSLFTGNISKYMTSRVAATLA